MDKKCWDCESFIHRMFILMHVYWVPSAYEVVTVQKSWEMQSQAAAVLFSKSTQSIRIWSVIPKIWGHTSAKFIHSFN